MAEGFIDRMIMGDDITVEGMLFDGILGMVGFGVLDNVGRGARRLGKEATEELTEYAAKQTKKELKQKLSKLGGKGRKGFKFSEMSEEEIQKIVKAYRTKAPLDIPELATARAKSMRDGYEQISYKWNDGGFKYEARWHTRTSGAPKGQGNTWVIQRTKPGNGGIKPYSEFLIGKDEWIAGYKWYDAINARKAGTATSEQKSILDRGHWKE